MISRRAFLASTSAALTFPYLLPAPRSRGGEYAPPSDRITVGVVGLGSRGFNLIDDLLRRADAQIVAICDVDSLHYRDRPWGKGMAYGCSAAREKIENHYRRSASRTAASVAVYTDYRELCAREDLDAVVIATPDHWHALIALEAMRAKRDVYCEKPVTHRFAEGRLLCDEATRRQTVFQVGSQQRSDRRFRRAVEIVRNGHLGKIKRVEIGLPSGYDKPQGDTQVTAPPDHLDYEMWCGPAPKLPYMRARHHRWWRGHTAFGGGVLMDWIGHHNDIAHWGIGMDAGGPQQVEAVDWVFPKTDVYDTPHHYTIRCVYPGGITSTISDRLPMGTRWIGESGWLYVRRGKWQASDPRWLQDDFDVGEWRLPPSPGHMPNFLECVKTRQTCDAPVTIAHRSITPGHLGYVSWRLHRPLKWDAQSEQVLGDDEANRLLMANPYRSPWKLG